MAIFPLIVGGSTTGAQAKTALNTAGTSTEISIKVISAIANVASEVGYMRDNTIVYSLAEDAFYQYDSGGGTWGVTDVFPTKAKGVFGGAAHYSTFSSTGHLTFTGDARPWRDETRDVINLQRTGSGVSLNSTEHTVDFTTGANLSDFIYVNMQLNHDRDLTSDLYPHIHWWQASSGVPNWLFSYRWQINGGLKTASWTNLKSNSVAHTYTSGTLHQISYSAAITPPGGTVISDILQFKIIRDNTNASGLFTGADPVNATVSVMSFDVHFMIDSLGSDNQYSK